MVKLYGMAGITRKEQAQNELLPRAVSEFWGLSELPAVTKLALGKPVFQSAPELHFNLSHSGTFALCALSEQPVGVDIEVLRPRREHLAEQILSPGELDWYQKNGADPAALLTLWTRKEAWCKKSGQGLTFPVREITPPLPGDGDEKIMRSYAGEGWRAAVCGAWPYAAEIIWLTPQ